MQKKFKLLSMLFLLTMFLGVEPCFATNYYLSVGCDYDLGGSSVEEANYVASVLKLKKYSGSLVLEPQYSALMTKISGTNRYTMESDTLYYLGHASSDSIIWNHHKQGGSYAVGIGNTASDSNYTATDGVTYKLVGIGKFDMSKVKLAVYQGCQTAANSSNNLPKYATSKGANCAIGWGTDIARVDTLQWTKKFFTGGITNTVESAVHYANSFNYVTTDIKNVKMYGNTTQKVILSNGGLSVMSAEATDNRRYAVNVEFDTNNLGENELEVVKERLGNIIEAKIGKNFDVNDYSIEKAESTAGKIYDLYFLLNGVKTSLGYTAFMDETGTVVTDIYDNMNGYLANQLKLEKQAMIQDKLEHFDVSNLQKRNVIVDKGLVGQENTREEIQDGFYYFDVEENKMYYISLVKVMVGDAHSIATYKVEM